MKGVVKVVAGSMKFNVVLPSDVIKAQCIVSALTRACPLRLSERCLTLHGDCTISQVLENQAGAGGAGGGGLNIPLPIPPINIGGITIGGGGGAGAGAGAGAGKP
jgi:hypothetical protein